MIKVAIYEVGAGYDAIRIFINDIYNRYVYLRGGEELSITAYVVSQPHYGFAFLDDICISLEEYVDLYKKGLIDALIIPVENFFSQVSVLTDILKAGLSLDSVYILKRLTNAEFSTLDDVVNHIEPYLSARYLPYVEYHVAEKCNMNCVACEHYSGLVKEESFPDFEQFSKEFYRMKELVDDIGMLSILGGEPLLNPELYKYVELSAKLYPYSRKYVVTNGLLVTKMDQRLISAIKEGGVMIYISYYPALIDKMEEIKRFLEDNGIVYEISTINTVFSKKQTLSASNNMDQYYKCFQAHCNNLYRGEMASCFLPFTTKYFNQQYKTSLPETGAISIMDESLTSEELLFGLLQPFERCKYCTDPVDVEWDIIKDKTDLSNWLVEVPKEKNKKEPLISIYTQCYNGEKYIEKCILSVLNQTYNNFEYFVCNHGSTDNTQEIVDKYAKLDSRIKPLFYPNAERGFYPDFIKENANGKYFAMLDSDDWWDVKHLEKLVSYAERFKLDMCICGIDYYNEVNGKIGVLRAVSEIKMFNISEVHRYWPVLTDFLRTAWGKIINMDALKKADFSTYKENAKTFIADDTAFALATFTNCKRVAIIPDRLLVYRMNEASVTAKYKSSMKENYYNIYKQTLNMLEEIGDMHEESREFMLGVLLSNINYFVEMLVKSDLPEDEKNEEINAILELPYIKAIVEDKGMEKFRFGQMIKDWLVRTGKKVNVLAD